MYCNHIDCVNDDNAQCCLSIGHLERDLSQKRVLVDDVKLKLSAAQENAEADADVMVLQICNNSNSNSHDSVYGAVIVAVWLSW